MTFKANKKITLATICLIICCLPSALAFWRLPCAEKISVQRADPIVNNGSVSGHIHTVMGASAFHARASTDEISESKCSTCTVREDNSLYWIPNMFYQHANGTMESVPQTGGMLVYYLQRTGYTGEKLYSFPKGFRMLAGNPNKRTSDNSAASKAITYACINYNGGGGPETGAFPQRACPQGLRAQVFFPSCWDGVNLDSPDHKSHVAYPSGVTGGKCPSTHPVHLISIFYEVTFQVDKFADGWLDENYKPYRAQPFYLSNGDNTGFGLHGDFMNGWDVDVLQKAVDECTDNSGVVEYCKHFTFRSNEDAHACKPEYLPAIDERVTGQFANIPNVGVIPVADFNPCGYSPNHQFDNTLTNVTLGTCDGVPTNQSAYIPSNGVQGSTTPAIPTTRAPDAIDQTGYLGCYQDGKGGRTMEKRIAGGSSFIPATCRQAVAALSSKYVVFGIQYGGECWASESATSYKSQGESLRCTMDCRADPTGNTLCGGPTTSQVYSVQV